MSTLVILDYVTCSVLFIKLSDDMVKSLVDDYENDSESWLADSGLEEKFGFSVSNSNWMLSDEEPEMFRCNPENSEMVNVFPFM